MVTIACTPTPSPPVIFDVCRIAKAVFQMRQGAKCNALAGRVRQLLAHSTIETLLSMCCGALAPDIFVF